MALELPSANRCSMAKDAMARACRAEPRLGETRLIAVSGYSSAEDHAKAREAGFDRLLPKPVTFETLDALLSEMAPVVEEQERLWRLPSRPLRHSRMSIGATLPPGAALPKIEVQLTCPKRATHAGRDPKRRPGGPTPEVV